MIYMNTSEFRLLRSAELNAGVGYVCALPASDSWADEWNSAWVAWCATVNRWNPEYDWSCGCTSGECIGTRLRSPLGTRRALASRLPD